MRVLIFHGYLLRGTGSNIYTANLVRALARSGHEVHLLCQDHRAAELDVVDALGDWDAGRLRVTALREPVRVTAYRPDLGGLLPVYVDDVYEHLQARPFPLLDDVQLAAYLQANVAAVAEVAARVSPDVVLANHLVMGPVIVARALEGRVPYAVKVHGSALEYTVKPHADRFLPYAVEGLAGARAVLVGSRHTAESLWAVVGDPALPARTRLGPPGVDVERFRPRAPQEAAAGLAALADRLEGGHAVWGGEADAATVLRRLDPHREPVVAYLGKLLVAKGVDLLLTAWPLVVAALPRARLVVVGFGAFRDGLAAMLDAQAAGDLGRLAALAARGRALEGGAPRPLTYVQAFLDSLDESGRRRYTQASRVAAGRVGFTGRLEHDDLPDLLPACSAQVVPSTFPEAFGMVAAEAAACGVLPLCAAHSGLAEVTATLAPALEPGCRPLLSFPLTERAVAALAERLVAWLRLDPGRRRRQAAALAAAARARYGWAGVAEGVLAAAQGRLDALPAP